MRDTRLEHAVLSFQIFEQADLSSAKNWGKRPDRRYSERTILLDADLKKADLRGGYLTGAVLRVWNSMGRTWRARTWRGALGITAMQVCPLRTGARMLDRIWRRKFYSAAHPLSSSQSANTNEARGRCLDI